MLGLVGSLAPQVKHASVKKVRIDTAVNKLHYQFTTIALTICCILVTAKEFVGKPIDCMMKTNKGEEFENAVNTYCWISSTYTLPSEIEAKYTVGEHIAHPGVRTQKGQEDQKKYHAYYQWVPFVLFLQAVSFYLPHYIWRNLDGNTLNNLFDAFNKCLDSYLHDGAEKDKCTRRVLYDLPHGPNEAWYKNLQTIANHLCNSGMRYSTYYASFVFCEVLSFVIVVGNIYFTDVFLGYEFSSYGTEVIDFINKEDIDRTDPLMRVFPRVTKCDWHQYGPTGTIEVIDALCVLAVNIMNEKVYLFLWFWFIILAVLTGCGLVVRLLEIFFPAYRAMRLRRFHLDWVENQRSRAVVAHVGLADWFILHEIKKNLHHSFYAPLLRMYTEELRKKFGKSWDAKYPHLSSNHPLGGPEKGIAQTEL